MSEPFTFPLSPVEVRARNHAILCTTGFLILLPIGALVARYTRTFTHKWWSAHWIIQFLVAGPIILAGWSMGYETAEELNLPHFDDTHQKCGLALLILYLAQLLLGAAVHFFKLRRLMNGHRAPHNYIHVLLGVGIFILAAYQVHYGLYTEWIQKTGGSHVVPQSAKHAWMALIIIFWVLYILGMGLLPRQFGQEKQMRKQARTDHIPLENNGSG